MAFHTWGGAGHDSECDVTINPDGSVEAKIGSQDLGTGTRTTIGIVIAETLGLPLEAVKVELGKNSYPMSGPSGGSTTIGGVSVSSRFAATEALNALLAVVALGDRRGLRATTRELDVFDADDRRWLLGRHVRQGRFNAGQKLNAAFTAAFAVLLAVSGVLLWLGERDTRFRLDSTIVLHDVVAYLSVALLAGHLYLAVIHPSTRHALRGMTVGTVREDWAREHHAKWPTDAQ